MKSESQQPVDQNPYAPPQSPAPHPKTRHSGIGVAAFVIAILSVLLAFGSFLAIGIFQKPDRFAEAPLGYKVLLAVFLGGTLLAFVSLALGIAALLQRDRKKLFAVLGLAIGSAFILFMCCLRLMVVVSPARPPGS